MTLNAVEQREVSRLYWDYYAFENRPKFTYTVQEIAEAYGVSTASKLRKQVDLSFTEHGFYCVDCKRLLVIKTRERFYECLKEPQRCQKCNDTAISTFMSRLRTRVEAKSAQQPISIVAAPARASSDHVPFVKERPKVANVSTVMSGEAAIHTVRGGTEIELRLPPLPEGGEYPPMMKLLAAIVHRADEEHGWWEDQVRWFDAYMREKRFAKTRMQLRLVSDNDKAPRK